MGWFAQGQLEAVLQSAAFPGEEYEAPDCDAAATATNGMEVACTRAAGHDGRHLAAVGGHMDGHHLFAVIGAWPGDQPPKADALGVTVEVVKPIPELAVT